MEQRYLGRIEPDMDVCDINGDKLGTVARVYRHEVSAVTGTDAATRPAAEASPPREEVIEVKSGFLGLGKHLYVPMSAVQDVTQGGVFLSLSKDEAESRGWDNKPAYLDELH